MIYLASPYSHPDPDVRQARYIAACEYTAKAMHDGFSIYSPIVYGHILHRDYKISGDWFAWRDMDLAILRSGLISVVWVLKLYKWEESIGVKKEIEFANDRRIPIEYKEP